jgi:uncharacterized protein YqjF (DUF2071 family)
MTTRFLTARWEHLIVLNYLCPPDLLLPYVPRGTRLDAWEEQTFLSLVGFLFRNTRIRGVGIPCHRTFEEVNLRFYVRREMPDGTSRRAVVFLRELVPRRLVAALARRLYNEPYLAVPMSNATDVEPPTGGLVSYFWYYQRHPFSLQATVRGEPAPSAPGSATEFVTEHYWGYTRQRDGGTIEYRVDHPAWRVWQPVSHHFEGPPRLLYGDALGSVLEGPMHSVVVAEGSEVAVYRGVRLPEPEAS